MSNTEGKSPAVSKTILFNLLTLLSVGVTAAADHTIVTENPLLAAGATVAVSLINIALRFVTKQPLK